MKLFLRIFLTFWITTMLMLLAAFSVSEILPFSFRQERKDEFDPEVAAATLATATNIYEQQGTAAFLSHVQNPSTIHHGSIYLFDQNAALLVKGSASPVSKYVWGFEKYRPIFAEMARDVMQSGHMELLHSGYRTLFAYPLQTATGRRYAAVLTLSEPYQRFLYSRFWFNFAIAMLPAALVSILISLYLTRPIRRLRATAHRLAEGDLGARASPSGFFGGGELGDLAHDFDVMAGRIQLLMTAQRRFVADVSHELGGPLTRMHLALALLRRRFAETNSEELERIERETNKLSGLVQQLLLLAGLEAGACPAESLEPVSIRSLCESLIEDANFEAAHGNGHVIGSREDVTLLVYPNLLRRAIDNVLRNAIRYAPAGTDVRLDCKVDLALQKVVLEVTDCGPGVPESMLSDIFQPFFRTAPGRESSSGGTGLGLAIAGEAVRVHDGTIAAKNQENGGLEVIITLPLRPPTPSMVCSRA